ELPRIPDLGGPIPGTGLGNGRCNRRCHRLPRKTSPPLTRQVGTRRALGLDGRECLLPPGLVPPPGRNLPPTSWGTKENPQASRRRRPHQVRTRARAVHDPITTRERVTVIPAPGTKAPSHPSRYTPKMPLVAAVKETSA